MAINHGSSGRAEYRRHAHDCVEAAVRAKDVGASAILLDLAFGWAKLIKQNEALRGDPDRGAPNQFQGVQVLLIKPKRH